MAGISRFFCDHCRKETHFVPIHRAILITGVSRSTVYYWIDKEWVHWVELPSGRRAICVESLRHSQVEPAKVVAKTAAA
jgi:predicted DNA-binding transcriptional regulator AlpA